MFVSPLTTAKSIQEVLFFNKGHWCIFHMRALLTAYSSGSAVQGTSQLVREINTHTIIWFEIGGGGGECHADKLQRRPLPKCLSSAALIRLNVDLIWDSLKMTSFGMGPETEHYGLQPVICPTFQAKIGM